MISSRCPPPIVDRGDTQSPGGAWRWMVPALVTLCLGVAVTGGVWKAWDMFGSAHRPMLQGWDDSFYYFWLPAVVIDHDLDFSKPLARSGTVDAAARTAGLAQTRTATGLLPNKYPPGWALGSLPFFLAARAVSPAASTGFEARYLIAVWFGQSLFAAAGLWLAFCLVRWLVPGAPAAVAVLTVWLASPLVYYQTFEVWMSHSQVLVLALTVFGLTLRAKEGDDRARVWVALGFCSALLVVTRNVAVVYLAFPAVLLFRQIFVGRRAALFVAGAAVPAGVQMVAWKILFGSWLVYSYGGESFDFAHPHLFSVLFSPRHGWFYWHPLLLIGVLAFAGWARRQPVGRPWLVSLAAITVLNACWRVWWLGSSFGNRGFEVPVFFAMIGLAVLLRAAQERLVWRRVLNGIISVAVLWNLMLLALFLTHRIPREDAVTYGDAVHALAGWSRGGH